jgi:hypothetical protein
MDQEMIKLSSSKSSSAQFLLDSGIGAGGEVEGR